MKGHSNHNRPAFSLIELLAIITILGIMAAIVVPRLAISSETAKQLLDNHNRATINAGVERWYLDKGAWPASDLSDVAADTGYFPEGLPTRPADGKPYTFDPTTHRVN